MDVEDRKKCRLLISDLKAAREDEIVGMAEYHEFADRVKKLNFETINLARDLKQMSNDEKEHKETLEKYIAGLEKECQS